MRKSGTTSPAPTVLLDLLSLEGKENGPQYQQLYRQMHALILKRILKPRASLPSTRALAADLGIARNTVIAVYEQLETEGYIETRHGARARVADLPLAGQPKAAAHLPSMTDSLSKRGRVLLDQTHRQSPARQTLFQPGLPDVKHFPFATWRRLLVQRLRPSADDIFGYHSFTGYAPLRGVIANYLEAARGVRCTPDQVFITTGAQGALDLLARLFLDPGDEVLLEEPGYTGAQGALLAAGAKLLPLPVDESGWHVPDIMKSRPRLIYVTPSCQFPLGLTMRMEQRLKIIELAEANNAWIIEDDFDSEYRFTNKPVPAMQGADRNDRTIYVGTFAKTLFPSLRIGFMVLPRALDERMNKALFLSGKSAPLFLQAALSDFIEQGHFAKHLRRMKRIYGARRASFVARVEDQLGEWLTPIDGRSGLQTVWKLRKGLEDKRVADLAREASFGVTPLSEHYHHGPGLQGLILGYAAVETAAVPRGLARLKALLRKAS